jgi:hypothetical protein
MEYTDTESDSESDLPPPPRLLSAFTDRAHADAFVREGVIRLGELRTYKKIEDDQRRDASEGDGFLLIPGDIPIVTLDRSTLEVTDRGTEPGQFHFSSTFVNPTYILSFALPSIDVGRLRARFGAYVVAVDEPVEFLERLHAAANRHPALSPKVGLDHLAVSYDKGGVGSMADARARRPRLSYAQKPPAFAGEQEYRVVIIGHGSLESAPREVFLRLGHIGEICRIA